MGLLHFSMFTICYQIPLPLNYLLDGLSWEPHENSWHLATHQGPAVLVLKGHQYGMNQLRVHPCPTSTQRSNERHCPQLTLDSVSAMPDDNLVSVIPLTVHNHENASVSNSDFARFQGKLKDNRKSGWIGSHIRPYPEECHGQNSCG